MPNEDTNPQNIDYKTFTVVHSKDTLFGTLYKDVHLNHWISIYSNEQMEVILIDERKEI